MKTKPPAYHPTEQDTSARDLVYRPASDRQRLTFLGHGRERNGVRLRAQAGGSAVWERIKRDYVHVWTGKGDLVDAPVAPELQQLRTLYTGAKLSGDRCEFGFLVPETGGEGLEENLERFFNKIGGKAVRAGSNRLKVVAGAENYGYCDEILAPIGQSKRLAMFDERSFSDGKGK